MRTRVYHITYYEADRSAYVQFMGCNFTCPWCIRRLTPWDHHVVTNLNAEEKTLSLNELMSIIEELVNNHGLRSVVLGGWEPTIDPALPAIIREFKGLGLGIRLLTNGYEISDELMTELKQCGSCEVVLSIKTLNEGMHIKYVGKPLKPVLSNLRRLYDAGIRVIVETVLIPGLNDVDDVEAIARYVAGISTEIPLIIDPYVPVPNTPWRRPSSGELMEAIERARRYLNHVTTHSSGGKVVGRVIIVYPRVSGSA